MRYWLGRFGFSFLIIGCALGWEALQAAQGNRGALDRTRIVLFGIGAAVCVVLGLVGIRLRHRQ